MNKKRSFSLFSLLVIIISLLSIFVTAAVIGIYTSIYTQSLRQSTVTSTEQAASNVSRALDIYTGDMKSSLDILMMNIEGSSDINEIRSYIDMMIKTRTDVAAVFIYDENESLIFAEGPGELKQDVDNLSFDPDMLKSRGFYITNPHIENAFKGSYAWVVTTVSNMYAPCLNASICIAMDIKFSSMAAYVNNVGVGEHGYCCVLNRSTGEVVYHPQQQLIFSGLAVAESFPEKDGSFVTNDAIYCASTLNNGLWRVVGVSFIGELVSRQVRGTAILIGIVCLLLTSVTIAITALLSRAISSPVQKLVRAMSDFEKSAGSYKYKAFGSIREFDVISESFGHMVKKIQRLMEQVKEEEISLRKTELKALQAQINPHFLYNTLDSIQWMCEQGKMQESVQMVNALAKLFRISINRGNELITVEQEINHAKSYLLIQSFRYKNQFSYEFTVDDSILDYMCNKITLQPIIENAIYHGIDRMIDEGRITIEAYGKDSDIVFRVTDNGVGMTEEQCENILSREASSGIGLKNVDERLKIYFGNKYGISISSELDEGTEITITFPKVKEGEYENK